MIDLSSSSSMKMINDYNKSKTDFCLFFHNNVNFTIKHYFVYLYIYESENFIAHRYLYFPRISFSLEKKNIKIFQFTKYAEKVIFPDKVQRIK